MIDFKDFIKKQVKFNDLTAQKLGISEGLLKNSKL